MHAPPADPCATSLACSWPRVSASAGSGEKVVLVGDSILAAFELPPGSLGTAGAPFAAAPVAQNGMRASAYTSVGSTFEHWNRGLIRRDAVDSGPITNQTIADLNALNQPVAHTVVALGANDAPLIANDTRTFRQVADQILASMNQAPFTSTGCLTGDGYGRNLDLVFLSTAAAKNGRLGC